jgi:uncharacterized membrane protein SirB2
MDYSVIKAVHVAAVAVTLGLFLLRAAWAVRSSARLRRRWVRIVPHLVDTTLLVSAVWLAYRLGQVPGRDAWLTAKVAGLLVYIVAGMMVIKRASTRSGKLAALAVALIAFAYIVSVALTKSPAPWT